MLSRDPKSCYTNLSLGILATSFVDILLQAKPTLFQAIIQLYINNTLPFNKIEVSRELEKPALRVLAWKFSGISGARSLYLYI